MLEVKCTNKNIVLINSNTTLLLNKVNNEIFVFVLLKLQLDNNYKK